MKRAAVVGSVLAAAAVAAVVVALLTRGGGNPTVQTVAGHRITRNDLDLVVEHFHEEADREGRPFPAKGTAAYKQVERSSLRLLIDRAAFEAAAARLGVRVTDAEVERRLAAAQTGESEGGGDIRIRAEAAFRHATVRTQLLTERVYRKLTAGIDVNESAVRAYYRRQRRVFGSTPYARVARTIRSELLAARRNAVYARWLAKVRRGEPAPKV